MTSSRLTDVAQLPKDEPRCVTFVAGVEPRAEFRRHRGSFTQPPRVPIGHGGQSLFDVAGVAKAEIAGMTERVVELTAPQAEEEDCDQLAGEVTDGHVAGHAAVAESLVVGAEWGWLVLRGQEMKSPEPNLAAGHPVARAPEVMLGDAGAGLPCLRVPAQDIGWLVIDAITSERWVLAAPLC